MDIGSVTNTVFVNRISEAQNKTLHNTESNEKHVRSAEANESRKAETKEVIHDETHEIGEEKTGSNLDVLA